MAQYVYNVRVIGKVLPPNGTVFEDVSLSFFLVTAKSAP